MSHEWRPDSFQQGLIDTETDRPPVITYPRRHTRVITVTLGEIVAIVLVSMLVGLLIFTAINSLP